MKFTLLICLAPCLVAAAAVPDGCGASPPPVPSTFTVAASQPGSPINRLPMQAGGLGFRLGGQAATYCPSVVGPSCPRGVDTVISRLSSMVSRSCVLFYSIQYLIVSGSCPVTGCRGSRWPADVRHTRRSRRLHAGPFRVHAGRIGHRRLLTHPGSGPGPHTVQL
jgi:hypothetical protein